MNCKMRAAVLLAQGNHPPSKICDEVLKVTVCKHTSTLHIYSERDLIGGEFTCTVLCVAMVSCVRSHNGCQLGGPLLVSSDNFML